MGLKAVLIATVGFLCLAMAPVAYAIPITNTFNFNATGFTPAGGPLAALSGSFTLTFDPALSYAFTSAGIAENSLNLPVSSVGFQYNPNANNGNLIIGGALNGVNVNAGTDDFALILFNTKTSSPFVGGAQYSTVGSTGVYGELFQGTVNVPEPPTVLFFGAGLLGLATLGLRRKTKKA